MSNLQEVKETTKQPPPTFDVNMAEMKAEDFISGLADKEIDVILECGISPISAFNTALGESLMEKDICVVNKDGKLALAGDSITQIKLQILAGDSRDLRKERQTKNLMELERLGPDIYFTRHPERKPA